MTSIAAGASVSYPIIKGEMNSWQERIKIKVFKLKAGVLLVLDQLDKYIWGA